MNLQDIEDIETKAYGIRDRVLNKMSELRVVCDEAEKVTAKKVRDFPTYGGTAFRGEIR